MAKRKGSPTSREGTSSQRESEGIGERDASKVENAKRLDKLPPEVWEKILDELDENDLFPLALSCRYFRQKQKELVARDVLNKRWRDRRALKTSLKAPLLWPKYLFREPPSADYLRFCSKERVSREVHDKRDNCIRRLAAYHGHLPLLQELGFTGSYRDAKNHNVGIVEEAGESFSSSLFPHLLASASDLFLLFFPSQRLDANWRPCSG